MARDLLEEDVFCGCKTTVWVLLKANEGRLVTAGKIETGFKEGGYENDL